MNVKRFFEKSKKDGRGFYPLPERETS